MPEPIENYVPQRNAERFRRQAGKVWVVTSIVILAWVGVIAAAPALAANGFGSASGPIYNFFSYICHQMPERSLHLAGHQLAVCSRCFGVYFGLLAGLVVYPLWQNVEETEPLPRVWLLLSLVPIGIDWSLTVFGVWENTHLSRFITGMILGAACATYIMPALVEIARNLSGREPRPAV